MGILNYMENYEGGGPGGCDEKYEANANLLTKILMNIRTHGHGWKCFVYRGIHFTKNKKVYIMKIL